MTLLHATCAALSGRGVLLKGPSGSGKSDLCLRLIHNGWRLVADDQVCLTSSNFHLIGQPPMPLRGLIEVRGVGILNIAYAISAPICLVVKLVSIDTVERIPEDTAWCFKSHNIPMVQIDPFEISAVEKISIALQESY
jgi:HPr kinase/phosphorylase